MIQSHSLNYNALLIILTQCAKFCKPHPSSTNRLTPKLPPPHTHTGPLFLLVRSPIHGPDYYERMKLQREVKEKAYMQLSV